jgi:hypothetical protein
MTSGLSLIISEWLWRVSITVSRKIYDGRGVTVVKTVRFDIVMWSRGDVECRSCQRRESSSNEQKMSEGQKRGGSTRLNGLSL